MTQDEHFSAGLEDEPFVSAPGPEIPDAEDIPEEKDAWLEEKNEDGSYIHARPEEIIAQIKARHGKIDIDKVKFVKVGKGKNQAYVYRHAALATECWNFIKGFRKRLDELNEDEYGYFLDRCKELGFGGMFKARKKV